VTFTVFLGVTVAVTLPTTLSAVLGWTFAIMFALIALACAAIAGDRRWERDRAVDERDQALAELDAMRAGHTDTAAPAWQEFLPPADRIDLPEAEVDARFADLQRTFNDPSDQ